LGIIDTGVQANHEDLTGRVSGDAGFGAAHGTHVAGIAGAKGNNNKGVAGVNWNAQLVSQRNDQGGIPGIAQAVNDAVAAGARVLNNSWGVQDYSQVLYDAFFAAQQADVLSIVANPEDGAIGEFPNPNLLSREYAVLGRPGPPPLSVTITGPSSISPGVEGTWSANVSGGSGTITYQWSVRYDGSSTFTNLGTNQNQSLTFPDDCTINDLKVDVIRGGQSAQDLQVVNVSSGPIFCKRAVEEIAQIPDKFDLHQNFPNPFNPETEIRFGLPEDAHVRVVLFDLLGREVRTLVDKDTEAGYHSIVWDGRDNSGQTVASGVYLYQMSAGNYRAAKKLMIMR
jgi:hypothetical protein